jgi:hypothetical protein
MLDPKYDPDPDSNPDPKKSFRIHSSACFSLPQCVPPPSSLASFRDFLRPYTYCSLMTGWEPCLVWDDPDCFSCFCRYTEAQVRIKLQADEIDRLNTELRSVLLVCMTV